MDNEVLLAEIRDLLIPISAVAKAQLAEEGTGRLRAIVGSGQRQRAAVMMDGTKTRADILKATNISAPNLSTLIKDLRDVGLVTETASRPKLVVGPVGVWKKTKGSASVD